MRRGFVAFSLLVFSVLQAGCLVPGAGGPAGDPDPVETKAPGEFKFNVFLRRSADPPKIEEINRLVGEVVEEAEDFLDFLTAEGVPSLEEYERFHGESSVDDVEAYFFYHKYPLPEDAEHDTVGRTGDEDSVYMIWLKERFQTAGAEYEMGDVTFVEGEDEAGKFDRYYVEALVGDHEFVLNRYKPLCECVSRQWVWGLHSVDEVDLAEYAPEGVFD